MRINGSGFSSCLHVFTCLVVLLIEPSRRESLNHGRKAATMMMMTRRRRRVRRSWDDSAVPSRRMNSSRFDDFGDFNPSRSGVCWPLNYFRLFFIIHKNKLTKTVHLSEGNLLCKLRAIAAKKKSQNYSWLTTSHKEKPTHTRLMPRLECLHRFFAGTRLRSVYQFRSTLSDRRKIVSRRVSSIAKYF